MFWPVLNDIIVMLLTLKKIKVIFFYGVKMFPFSATIRLNFISGSGLVDASALSRSIKQSGCERIILETGPVLCRCEDAGDHASSAVLE